MRLVLATVGLPPRMFTTPPLTLMAPAAFRPTLSTLSRLSPRTIRVALAGVKIAVIAGTFRPSRAWRAGKKRVDRAAWRRALRGRIVVNQWVRVRGGLRWRFEDA